MNWAIIIIVGILAVALVVFLVIRNQKDEKQFERKLNRDYPKYEDKESETTDEPNNDEVV